MSKGVKVDNFRRAAKVAFMSSAPELEKMRFATAPTAIQRDNQRSLDPVDWVGQPLSQRLPVQKVKALPVDLRVEVTFSRFDPGAIKKQLHFHTPLKNPDRLAIRI